MKIKILIAALSLAFSASVNAQTVTTNASGGTTAITGPINQVETWATSFNTNNSIAAAKGDITTGTREVTGSTGVGSVIAARLYIHTNYVVGVVGGFGAAGTAFNSFEGEFAYRFYTEYDFALDGGVLAGYDGLAKNSHGQSGAYEVEPEFVASKLITTTSVARVRITKPVETVGKGNGNVGIYAEIGFSFP